VRETIERGERPPLRELHGAVVVAMISVRVMQASVDEVVYMVAMRDRFVAATRPVGVTRTTYVRRALNRIDDTDSQHMFIDMIVMHMV
jgi:hypothetical protein